MKNIFRTCCTILFATFALNATLLLAFAQEPPATPPAGVQEMLSQFPGRSGGAPEIKPYDKVITKDAKSDEGVFTVHRIKDKIYYEIPKQGDTAFKCAC